MHDQGRNESHESGAQDHLPELGAAVLQHEGRVAFQTLINSAIDTICDVAFPVKFDGQLATCVVMLKAHDSLEDQADTRAQWCGTEKLPQVALNPDSVQFTKVTAMLASHRPRNWGSQKDMLLVGSRAVAILSSISVKVAGGTLGLSCHVSFKGTVVPDNTFAKMATAFRNGNSIRFGLHHTGIPSSSSTPDRPFAAWSMRAAGGALQARSSTLVLYPFVARSLVDHPRLWATTAARAGSAVTFAALDGIFSGRRTTAAAFLKALYQANKKKAEAYASKVVGQAGASEVPLMTFGAHGSDDVKVKGARKGLKVVGVSPPKEKARHSLASYVEEPK